MTEKIHVDREWAEAWSVCFRALGDPSRVMILHVLATARRPLTVGEIVEAVDVGQSTVSHHLRILADACFVHVERQGTASWFRVNEKCMDELPAAAAAVMGTAKTRDKRGRMSR